nr:hypothetical protein [Prosthecomicrobium hirschii]
MLDALMLLNEDQVSIAIRSTLDRICRGYRHRNKRIALYAEREFQESEIFPSILTPDRYGVLRRRAVGSTGPSAVKPLRNSPRVGSEGFIAFLASQQKDAWPKIFKNHPGPDRLRAKSAPAGEIIILTDFIGSGNRIRSMLDKFWSVPSIKSWVSRKLITFRVVSAAATDSGLKNVRHHRLRPEVISEWIAPVVYSSSSQNVKIEWCQLIENYGPPNGRGCGRYGFGGEAALIAFSYRIPNNTPNILHQSEGAWHALYEGPAPTALSALFGIRPMSQILQLAASANGIKLEPSLLEYEKNMIIILSLLRGRMYTGSEIELAEKCGIPVPIIFDILREASKRGFITSNGRLTDDGYKFLRAGTICDRKKPIVATRQESYYPKSLRVPR